MEIAMLVGFMGIMLFTHLSLDNPGIDQDDIYVDGIDYNGEPFTKYTPLNNKYFITAADINAIISDEENNHNMKYSYLTNSGEYFINMSKKYNIDPVFILYTIINTYDICKYSEFENELNFEYDTATVCNSISTSEVYCINDLGWSEHETNVAVNTLNKYYNLILRRYVL